MGSKRPYSSSSMGAKRSRYSSSSKKTYKRKANYTKYPGNASRVAVPYTLSKGMGPFPQQLKNTLRYSDQVQVVTTVGNNGNGQFLFCANGLYDPNLTGVGHQPLYYQQLAAIYDHYTCLYSKIRVQLTSLTTAPIQWCIFIDDDTTTGTGNNMNNACERTGAISGIWNAGVSTPPAVGHWWSAVSAFGGDPLANDNLQGSLAANPLEIQTYVIQLQDLTGAANSYQVKVDIEYTVVWDELKSMAQSG